MPVVSIKSRFGKLYGLTRASSSFPTERFYAKGGFMGPAVYLSTSEGSEALVDIAGFTSVESLSTGTAAVNPRGVTIVTSGASSLYTMAAPPGSGVRKVLVTTSTSTANRQITSAANIVTGLAASGGDGTITASTAMTVLTFNAPGQVIELTSISTSAWVNTGLRGYSTGVGALSS